MWALTGEILSNGHEGCDVFMKFTGRLCPHQTIASTRRVIARSGVVEEPAIGDSRDALNQRKLARGTWQIKQVCSVAARVADCGEAATAIARTCQPR